MLDNPRLLVKRVILIIFLTDLLAAMTLSLFFKQALGYILGSAGSVVYFLLLARDTKQILDTASGKAGVKAFKTFYLKYVFLILYSVAIVKFVPLDIFLFGIGLLSSQIAIYVSAGWESLKNNKYFRG